MRVLVSRLFLSALRRAAFRNLASGVLAVIALGASPAFSQSSTSTSLAVSGGGTVAFGTVVTLTATTTSNGVAVSPGQIKFCDVTSGAACTFQRLLAISQLTSAGVATYKFIPGSGTHVYQAIFFGVQPGGDSFSGPTLAGSTSSTSSLTVTGNSTTSIVKSGTQGNYTLASKVTGEGLSFPNGTLSFKDTSNGNAVVASASLLAGTSARYPKSISAVGAAPGPLVTGDFNGDGFLDLAVASPSGNSITLLLGNGDGTFTTLPNPTVTNSPTTLAAGDFDSDGRLDLVVADASGTVTSLKGDGHGSFTSVNILHGEGSKLFFALHDTEDGKLDLYGTSQDANGALANPLVGTGDGKFVTGAYYDEVECPYSQEALVISALAPFHIERQQADIVVVGMGFDQQGGPIGVIKFGPLANDGDCHALSASQRTGTTPVAVASGDLNGDGIADFVVVNQGDNTLSIFLGNANGSLTTVGPVATGPTPSSVVVGDFDGDGISDLAVANGGDGTITLFKGAGGGTFTILTTLAAGSAPSFLVAGDFNGNGQLDLAVSNSSANTATVMVTSPMSTATATASGVNPGFGTHLVDAVFPSDTHYYSSFSPTVDLSRSNTSTTVSGVSPASVAVGGSTTLTASVANTETPATSPVGSVTFSTTIGGSTYAACTATVTNSVASCAYTATYFGANAITAVFTPASTADFSSSADATGKALTVTAGALSSLTVTGFPSPVHNGTAHAVTVTAYDTTGSLNTGYTGTVTLSSNDPLATLPAAYTFVAGDSGVHSFSVTLATGGTRTITATDSATSISASQTGIVVDDFIWVLNNTGTTTKLDNSAALVTNAGTAGTVSSYGGVAFDASGNAWSVTSGANSLKMSSKADDSPTVISGSGGLNAPVSVAVDGVGSVWVANSGNHTVSVFSNSGTAQSNAAGYGSASVGAAPSSIAIDNSGGVWITSRTGNSVTHLIGSAAPVVTPQANAVAKATVGMKP